MPQPIELQERTDSSAVMPEEHDVELQNVRRSSSEREQIIHPPTDTGYRAWLLLAGCFVINVLIWGTSGPKRVTKCIF